MKQIILAMMIKTIPLWIVVLLVLQVIFSNQLVYSSQKAGELDDARLIILEENEILNYQLASITSVQAIEKNAKILGFVKVPQFISLDPSSFSVALQMAN